MVHFRQNSDQNFEKIISYKKINLLFTISLQDLKNIGIMSRGHRQKLLREIRRIPRVEIEEGVPVSTQ